MAIKKKHVPKFSTFHSFLVNFRKTVQDKVHLKGSASEQSSIG
jgi:hypothetical protein